jgi:hypothetical protein
VNPQIAEVVFVDESLKAPQLQLADQGFMCLGVEEHAAVLMATVLATTDLEAMKVHVLPAERDLQDLVKPGDARVAAHQQAPADQRADAAQHAAQLQDLLALLQRDVVEAIRAAAAQESPEAIEKRIREAVQQALANSGAEIKMREVALKEKKGEVEIQKILAEAVQIGVQSAFSAMQSGAQVAQMPQIAPIADVIMAGAGYRKPTPRWAMTRTSRSRTA